MRFCFIHGWGYDPDIWQSIIHAFPTDEHTIINLGFFGSQNKLDGEYDIAVTHSYGLMKLLQNPHIKYKKLISISGIAAYAKSDSPIIPKSQLRAMRAQLAKNPKKLIENFYEACGDQTTKTPENPNTEILNQALLDMEGLDLRDELADKLILALASREDKIVPAKLTQENFGAYKIVWHESGSHVLPITASDWCVAQIKEYINA